MNDGDLSNDPVLAEIVRRFVPAHQPESIYLFGSRARGEDGPDSDHDILIVVPDAATSERHDPGLACRERFGIGTAVDPIVCSGGRFHARTHSKASLPGTVLREGRLLHAT